MESPNLFIGIDPGISGGVCATTGGVSVCSKCPGTIADMSMLMSNVLDLESNPICIIEAVHSMPGQGVASTFKFGMNYGQWIGILAALQVPYIQVTPSKWMKVYGAMPKEKTQRKNQLKHLAQQRYPELSITLATSDAVLLAHYAIITYKINQ